MLSNSYSVSAGASFSSRSSSIACASLVVAVCVSAAGSSRSAWEASCAPLPCASGDWLSASTGSSTTTGASAGRAQGLSPTMGNSPVSSNDASGASLASAAASGVLSSCIGSSDSRAGAVSGRMAVVSAADSMDSEGSLVAKVAACGSSNSVCSPTTYGHSGAIASASSWDASGTRCGSSTPARMATMAQMQLARMKVGRTMKAAINAISPPDSEIDILERAPLGGGCGLRRCARQSPSYVQLRRQRNNSEKYAKWQPTARCGASR